MGDIKHQWNGSVLTVISDSGATSADLKGPKGDTGPRGPQGPGGVIYNEQGELVLDLSKYYSRSEVDDLLEDVEVDLSDYATQAYVTESIVNHMIADDVANKTYVDTEIARAQMEGAGIDTSNFITKENINIYAPPTPVDNATIIKAEDGTISTSIGGYVTLATNVAYHALPASADNTFTITPEIRDLIKGGEDKRIFVQINFSDGKVESYITHTTIKEVSGMTMYRLVAPTTQSLYTTDIYTMSGYGVVWFNDSDYLPTGVTATDIYIKEYVDNMTIKGDYFYLPINPYVIPVDGKTIIINQEGKLEAVGGAALESSEEVLY